MKKRKPTPQAKKLYGELRKRDVNAVMEYFDGHKCVDIGIPDAYIYIEVDGENHLTDPSQIERDFERDHYSEVEGVHTIHISNRSIDEKVERIAEAISKVVDKRKAKVKRIID